MAKVEVLSAEQTLIMIYSTSHEYKYF